MTEAIYKCTHCGHRFQHEHRYLRHTCDPMKRQKLFQEPLGQTAWILYQKWMRNSGKPASNAKAFLNSRFFKAFVRFAEFTKKAKVADVDVYVEIMCERQISPPLWTREEVYNAYLEHLDRKLPPVKHASITVTTLMNWAEDCGVDVADVFDTLTPPDLIKMVRERRVSPWILLHSPKFGDFVVSSTTPEQRIILETLMRPAFWSKKFNQDPSSVELMKTLVKELKI